MMRFLPFPLALFGLSLLVACGASVSNLPSAVGGLDEVVFVEDPRFAKDTLYKRVDARLQQQYGNFLQFEPTLDLLTITLEDLTNTLEKHRNLLFVGILDTESDYNQQIKSLLGQEGMETVHNGGVFTAVRKNVWANGQNVHVIVGSDRARLEVGLDRALEETVTRIQESEFEKYRKFVYALGQNPTLTRELESEHNIGLKIPQQYKKHPSSNGDFLWYRRSTVDLTASIMVYSHPYQRQLETAPEYAIFVRDSLGKRYERSDKPGAYMATEKFVRPVVDTVNLNGHFAIRTQSLWRLVGDFMGGPFVNYMVYDKANNRIIHLDAYIYAPDIRGKRKLVRELDAVLTTFSIPEPSGDE